MAHIGFGHPVCGILAEILGDAIAALNLPEFPYIEEVPIFVWKALPFPPLPNRTLYRSWGADVIGMTNLPEAKLAREAEIAYATLALVTDYDCWHPEHDHVTVEMILDNLHRNATNAQKVIRETVRRLSQDYPPSKAHRALKYAILTPLDQIPAETKARLALLLKKYL